VKSLVPELGLVQALGHVLGLVLGQIQEQALKQALEPALEQAWVLALRSPQLGAASRRA
tara:strand:- start:232 stop:408 length:177 start_codon:yes stop_codon:yes gene_type:complete